MTGSDAEVTSFDQKSPGSGCRRPRSRVLGTFELVQGCNSPMWQSLGRKWRHV